MQEDNVHRKSTDFFLAGEPDEQREERQAEERVVLNSLPVIKEVIERLEADITFYSTNEGVSDDVLTNPAEFMHTVAGNKKAVASLKREVTILKSLVGEHTS